MSAIQQIIEDSAAKPLVGRMDGIQFRNRSLKELVEADAHLDAVAAAAATAAASEANRRLPGIGQFQLIPV